MTPTPRHQTSAGENASRPAPSSSTRQPSSPAPSSSAASSLDVLIAALPDLDADQLRLQWRNHLGGTPPAHLPRWLLARVLAQRVQIMTLGDLDKATRRILRRALGDGGEDFHVRPFAPRDPATRDGVGLKAGALLVREWNGALQRVMVLEKGFAWNGKTFSSLSRIAKAMTGTSWNGHRFFGLRPASANGGAKSIAPKRGRLGGSDATRPVATVAAVAAGDAAISPANPIGLGGKVRRKPTRAAP